VQQAQPEQGNGHQPSHNGQGGHGGQAQEQPARPPRTVTFDDSDELDVPDFLK
jgi:cell division protein FtsZ